jgi:hypothetical protein
MRKIKSTFISLNLGKQKNNKNNGSLVVTHLKEGFGALVESLKNFQTPAPPRSMVKRPERRHVNYT